MKYNIIRNIRKNPTLISFIQYGIIGIIGTIVHTIVLTACVELFGVIPVVSTILGFLCSLIISYILNSMWTFKRSKKIKAVLLSTL